VTGTRTIRGEQEIEATVVRVLQEMTSDWDLELSGGIVPSSRLVSDLGFESLDVVMLILALEEQLGHNELPWTTLLLSGDSYVEDLTVADVTLFLRSQLGGDR
jgi:acyl carrier protein